MKKPRVRAIIVRDGLCIFDHVFPNEQESVAFVNGFDTTVHLLGYPDSSEGVEAYAMPASEETEEEDQ